MQFAWTNKLDSKGYRERTDIEQTNMRPVVRMGSENERMGERKCEVLTFGSSWSFTTLAARAIGWSEPAACNQKSKNNQILGKLSIPFPAAVLVNYDQPVVGRKDDD